ncbi:MAG TPA: hypothetical protein VLF91_03620 [Candidatus Saccharimonadales bacterium]|nr:hypothetical protein [Candidatus Saccharimonadales bacterium]
MPILDGTTPSDPGQLSNHNHRFDGTVEADHGFADDKFIMLVTRKPQCACQTSDLVAVLQGVDGIASHQWIGFDSFIHCGVTVSDTSRRDEIMAEALRLVKAVLGIAEDCRFESGLPLLVPTDEQIAALHQQVGALPTVRHMFVTDVAAGSPEANAQALNLLKQGVPMDVVRELVGPFTVKLANFVINATDDAQAEQIRGDIGAVYLQVMSSGDASADSSDDDQPRFGS